MLKADVELARSWGGRSLGRVDRVDHLDLVVADLDRSLAFYGIKLELVHRPLS